MGTLSFLFGYSGRIGRLAYAAAALVFPLVGWLLQAVCEWLPLTLVQQFTASFAIELLIDLAGTVSGCALTVKRLHDLNKPGTWLISAGIFSPTQWLELVAKPGDVAPNDFGEPSPPLRWRGDQPPSQPDEPAWATRALDSAPAPAPATKPSANPTSAPSFGRRPRTT
jgi:uncharacterized membrane protein YhaH (DUF805 family)